MPDLKRNPIGRPPLKQQQIAESIRSRIIRGELVPAGKLPTRKQLETTFQASPVTVQAALDDLSRSGFVEARGTQGTFVADHPPHTSHYAIVFAQPQERMKFIRLWTALIQEAVRMHHDSMGRRRLKVWYGIDGHQDNEDYHRLVADVKAHRLAGLIFATAPVQLRDTPLLEEHGVPRVAIMTDWGPGLRLPRVDLAGMSLMDKVLDLFIARKRRKIGAVVPPQFMADAWRPVFERQLAARGLETRPYWLAGVNQSTPFTAREHVQLMMRLPKEDRPDGLFIADDNLLEFSTAGLIAAGISVPDEIDVVTHTNFPYPTPSVVPVSRVGYDSRAILQTCIDLIDRQRQGTEVPEATYLDAVREDELPVAAAPASGSERHSPYAASYSHV